MTIRRTTGIALAMCFAVSTLALAQPRRGTGPIHYDPASEITMTGRVDDVRTVPGPGRGPGALRLIVHSDAGVTTVHLGPASYVTSKQVTFAKGDAVTITGVKTKLGNDEVLLAREVKKGDQVLTLRDAQGRPLWAGRRGRA